MSTPVLHVVVGPNGAGKSTLYNRVLGPRTQLPFVNADLMFAEMPGRFADEYEAGIAAAEERSRRITRRESFVTETVFSHPSKLNLLRDAVDAGYRVHLHVVAIPVDLAVRRVDERTARGGHDVDEDKIRGRYERLWDNVVAALGLVHELTVYDNTSAGRALRPIAYFRDGQPMGPVTWPTWAPAALGGIAPPA